MTNKKQTTLRILPPTKKAAHTAVIYGILGFFAGAFISAVGSYVYFSHGTVSNSIETKALTALSRDTEIAETTIFTNPGMTAEKPAAVSDVAQHDAVPEDEHALEFPQPQDADLGKAFMHPDQLKPTVNAVKPVVSHLVQPTYAAKNNTVKTPIKSKVAPSTVPLSSQITAATTVKSEVQKKEPDVEEAPQASTKIVVTRTPFVVKETAITP